MQAEDHGTPVLTVKGTATGPTGTVGRRVLLAIIERSLAGGPVRLRTLPVTPAGAAAEQTWEPVFDQSVQEATL